MKLIKIMEPSNKKIIIFGGIINNGKKINSKGLNEGKFRSNEK